MSQIEISNLIKTYDKFNALDGIDVSMELGKEYVIKGASGSGKSTLLYLMGGLDKPSEGKIVVDGFDLSQQSDDKLAKYRNKYIGFIFQFHFLLPSMNALQNTLLPAKIGNASLQEVESRVQEMAEKLGVVKCLKKYPYQLSGGEQQRINIIRALSLKPKLLLCDEPTGNLDSKNSELVTHMLKELAKDYHSTLIVVTHDNDVAVNFEHQLLMKDGKLV